MLVKTSQDGRDHIGLHVGTSNARRYFRKQAQTIDLRLGDLEIQCRLSPDFWQGRPEIYDPRLSEWLEFKVGRGRPGQDPMLLTMAPSGSGAFVVTPRIRTRTRNRTEAFDAETSPPRRVKSESYFRVSSAPILESSVA
jgi:hypothetical protein